jgi:hypothetical protein
MSNLSFSDLSVSQRRERIAALLAVGLQRVLDQKARISANSGDFRQTPKLIFRSEPGPERLSWRSTPKCE